MIDDCQLSCLIVFCILHSQGRCFLCLTQISDASIFADYWYVQITIDLVFFELTTIPLDPIVQCFLS